MFSKHQKPWDRSVLGPAYSLGRNIEDCVSNNLISAAQGQDMINDAVASGVRQLGPKKRSSTVTNAARTWKRARLSKTFWPKTYTFKAWVWCPRSKQHQQMDVSIWLPHELLHMLVSLGDLSIISSTEQMDPQTKRHLESQKLKYGIPNLIGVGMHGDGIPNNYDRTKSCYGVTINLPGVGGKFSRMRIPVSVGPSERLTDRSMHDINEILAWSFRHALAGTWPERRHDGSPWLPSDKSRASKTGNLGFNATLVEVRGDWDWYAKILSFPFHNETDGVCWLCPCKRDEAFHPTLSLHSC